MSGFSDGRRFLDVHLFAGALITKRIADKNPRENPNWELILCLLWYSTLALFKYPASAFLLWFFFYRSKMLLVNNRTWFSNWKASKLSRQHIIRTPALIHSHAMSRFTDSRAKNRIFYEVCFRTGLNLLRRHTLSIAKNSSICRNVSSMFSNMQRRENTNRLHLNNQLYGLHEIISQKKELTEHNVTLCKSSQQLKQHGNYEIPNGVRISRTATSTAWYEDARTMRASVKVDPIFCVMFGICEFLCVGSPVTLLCGRSRYFW